MSTYLFEEARELEKKHIEFAIVTIIKAKGSTPRTNAKMIVTKDGIHCGTVGGGYGEYKASLEAIDAINKRTNKTMTLEIGLEHSKESFGEVEMFVDVIIPKKRIILIGGGHVNYCIYKLAISCNFDVEVVENREEFANKDRFPQATNIIVEKTIAKAINNLAIDEQTAIVISTHLLDQKDIDTLVSSKAFYVGMLGSRKKIRKQREHLNSKGISLENYYSPIGLDVGAETPEQIGVSVLAEIMKVSNKASGKSISRVSDNLVIVRGAGDLASATIARLLKSGFRVIALEVEKPMVIRRTVSFAQAIYDGQCSVEGIVARKAKDILEAKSISDRGEVAVLVDPNGDCIKEFNPIAIVDGILAKKNIGNTNILQAPIVIALGPGFTAGKDAHAVIETSRGHYLGKIITSGSALPNTGIPGSIEGFSRERVIHSPSSGIIEAKSCIGDIVKKGQVIATVSDVDIKATIDGVLRGLIQPNTEVAKGLKIADIDPRPVEKHIYTFSDKARAISGSILEYILSQKV